MSETTTIEKIVMAVSGLLITTGMFVLGILEALIGNPAPVPQTNDAGEVVATTTFPVELRTTLIALGFLLLALYAVFRVYEKRGEYQESTRPEGAPAE